MSKLSWTAFKNLCLEQVKREENPKKNLLMVEYPSWIYGSITAIMIVCLSGQLANPYQMLETRLALVGGTALLMWLYRIYPCNLTIFTRVLLQFLLLIFWYPETYEFNRLFPNQDHLFATAEQLIFGCQPAVEFSKWLTSTFWSEMFNLGYWSYYPMIFLVVVYHLVCRPKKAQRVAFAILTSFFIYYFVYMFLPVAGPQYYYPAIGYPEKDIYEIAQNGFPALGDYFTHNSELLPGPGNQDGFFAQRVAEAQAAGERPTAAFPSSHVGVTTILLLIAWINQKKLLYVLLPLYVLLVCATVYIQAHYLIDAIAGFLTSFPVFYLSDSLYYWLIDKPRPSRPMGSF